MTAALSKAKVLTSRLQARYGSSKQWVLRLIYNPSSMYMLTPWQCEPCSQAEILFQKQPCPIMHLDTGHFHLPLNCILWLKKKRLEIKYKVSLCNAHSRLEVQMGCFSSPNPRAATSVASMMGFVFFLNSCAPSHKFAKAQSRGPGLTGLTMPYKHSLDHPVLVSYSLSQ